MCVSVHFRIFLFCVCFSPRYLLEVVPVVNRGYLLTHRGNRATRLLQVNSAKPDMVSEFLEFWRTAEIVNDRGVLIGEFLSEGHSVAEFDWITWPLTGRYRSFVDIGYWNSGGEFQA